MGRAVELFSDLVYRQVIVFLQDDGPCEQRIDFADPFTSFLYRPCQFQLPDFRTFSGGDLLSIELIVVADFPSFMFVTILRIRAVST